MASLQDKQEAHNGEASTKAGTRQVIAASYERVSSLAQARPGYSLGAQAEDRATFCAGQPPTEVDKDQPPT